jgi:hypothetical protein
MSLYLIGVDVVHHAQDWNPTKEREAALELFFRRLKGRRALNHLWLVPSKGTALELLQALKQHLGARDGVVITEVGSNVAHRWTLETISDLVQGA